MQLTIYIGIIQLGLTLLMSLGLLFSILHPKVLTSATLASTILLPLCSLLMTWVQQGVCRDVPELWWISLFFLFLNLFTGLGALVMLTGTLWVKEDYIYRISWYILPRKYTWADVEHYCSGWDQYKRKRRVIKNFEIEICFADEAESLIIFKEDTSPKAIYLQTMLRTHRCKRSRR